MKHSFMQSPTASKRTKGGEISPLQAEWISTLTAQGYRACVCYGWEAAWALIISYLEGNE